MLRTQGGLLLSLLAFAFCSATGKAWTADTFPNPMTDYKLCHREHPSWVCDPDMLLTLDDLNVIEGHIRAIYAGEEPYGLANCKAPDAHVGWQIAVAVVKRIDGHDPHKVATFAQRLHAKLGVGDEMCGTGAVLVLSVQDREVYISSGKAALRRLTNKEVSAIIKRMGPELRVGEYGTAVKDAVISMGLVLSGDSAASKGHADGDSPWWSAGIIGVFVSVFGAMFWRSHRQRSQFSAARTHLQQMQNDLRNAGEGRYQATSCPICLDDFELEAGDASMPPGGKAGGKAAAKGSGSDQAVEAEPLLADSSEQGSRSAAKARLPSHTADVLPGEDAADGQPPQASVKRPFLLPCGHTFCQPCILKWLENHSLCPVCRGPVHPRGGGGDDGSGPSSRPRPPQWRDPADDPASPNRRYNRRYGFSDSEDDFMSCRNRNRPYLGRDLYLSEFAFRMAQMRNRYPGVITDNMVNDMTRQATDLGTISFQNHHDFQARDPAVQQARRDQGASFGSTSFGGGHSAGGSGGTW